MALHFNFKGTPIAERLNLAGNGVPWDGGDMNPFCYAMSWTSMVVGVGSTFTEDLVREHLARIQFLEGLDGPYFYFPEGMGWRDIVPADFVGMSVNVEALSRLAWLKRIAQSSPDPCTRDALAVARRARLAERKPVIEEISS
jgi:hypothetical protein